MLLLVNNSSTGVEMSEYYTLKQGEMTIHYNLKDKDRKLQGKVIVGDTKTGNNASVRVGKTITLFDTTPGEEYEYGFGIGDEAEYDSYNLQYIGKITKIGAKTVAIEGSFGQVTRLSLYDFSWRNNYSSIQEKRAKNSEAMRYL